MARVLQHRPAYPPEFRAEAIRLAQTSGRPRSEIAHDLGMSSETLRLWLKQADLDEGQRQPEAGLIHHFDHGSQHTSLVFGERCRAVGIGPSRGTSGDCYDNALMESFFATLQCELLALHRFRTHQEARAAVLEWIEVFYNRQRRHSALGSVPPAVYEHIATTPPPAVA